MPETAKRTARVPILGEDGRISDDYIPAAIGENVTKAESAATRAETAATDAEGSASAASQSAAQASGSASAASASASQAQQSATAAAESATSAQSAQTAAEAAKAAAETAQSAAAGSAHDAQQSATAAQQSAASVADKFISSAQATTLEPGSQATASVADQVLTLGIPRGDKGDKGDQGEKGDTGTGVPDGGTPGQLLSKTDSGTAWVDPPSGNVLTGEAEGYVAHAEDAYAQKPIEVRVKGKTWVNRWPVINGTSNGITASTDETGLVTITGIATANTYIGQNITSIAKNTNITIVRSVRTTGIDISVDSYNDSGYINTVVALSGSSGTTQATGNTGSNDFTRLRCTLNVAQGTTVNASFRVMLVDGTEAPDCFTPPASIASVETGKLVTSGKNLLPTSIVVPDGSKGLVATVNDDGSYHISGTSTSTYANPINGVRIFLNPGTYTLSGRLASENSKGFFYAQVGIGDGYKTASSGPTSFEIEIAGVYDISFTTPQVGETFDGDLYAQLELGSTATAYEPPTVTQTPLPEVELRSLPNGTCDELVVKADGTCEVERKTGYIASYTDEEVTGEYVSTGNGLEAGSSIVYELDEPTAESQSTVTLPTLPAPTFNQYHDADVPSDTSVEYERDINIAFRELQAQVSATTVREATNG